MQVKVKVGSTLTLKFNTNQIDGVDAKDLLVHAISLLEEELGGILENEEEFEPETEEELELA